MQYENYFKKQQRNVTILILIDGFLQYNLKEIENDINKRRHNPYFNRWFSAIKKTKKHMT